MGDDIMVDNDVLISLVEARPQLWDKTLETFKDRNGTRDAWREVCCALKEDFEELENKDKNAFGKAVTKRWANLRDAYSKSKRKQKECKKSGAGAPSIKKYVYANQMQFLDKLFQSREVVESFDGSSDISHYGGADDVQLQESFVRQTDSFENNRGQRKRYRQDNVELKLLKALEPETPNPHMSFFQGLLPHLSKFDDSEVLEFQMGVLKLISEIKNKSQPLLPKTPHYHYQNYPPQQPQALSHPQQPYSNSNQFNSHYNNQAPLPQTLQFHNPQNLNHLNLNNQQACSSQTKPPVSQTNAQVCYQQYTHSSIVSSPDNRPAESPSPCASECTNNTFDFS